MNLRKIIREEMENPLSWISEVPEPFQIETTPFKGESKKYWITKGEKIKAGDFVVYQTASGLWREYGIMNPEKVNNANEANSEYYKVLKVVNESEEDDLKWIIDIEPQNYQWSATQNLINQTEIIPNAFMGEPMIKVPFTNLQFNEPKHFSNVHTFKDYIKSNYGIEDPLTITNIFNMWSAEINKKLKNLNESEEINDFTWVTDEPINPWLQYSMIIFDEEPTREEINNYIELALNTGRISNKEAWEIGREQDIDGILEYIRQDGGAVLKIDQWGDLQYADISYYNSSHNAIRYSQLVNKNLNESEEDEWDWARGPVFTNEFNIGDRIRIHNLGGKESFLSWLGDYRDRFLDGMYGEQIEGEVDYISGGVFSLVTEGDIIHFPTEEKMLDLNSMDDYKNLYIGYELI